VSLKVAIALAGAALLAWDALARASAGGARWARLRHGLLVALALVAALGNWNFAPQRILSMAHGGEFLHHYLGAKYFPELGYTHLYTCTIVVDHESGFPIPPEQRPVRRLENNELTTAAALLAEPHGCRERFGPIRWQAFQRDVAFLRAHFTNPGRWARMMTDHGMNASPAWVALAHWVISDTPITQASMLRLALLDPLLMVLAWGALFASFGWRTACVALIYWGTNAPADPKWTMGAFLRQDWLAAVAIGLALLHRGWPAAGGFALTWAALLRVFPGFLVASVLLHGALDLARRRSLRPTRETGRFVAGCAAAVVAGVALSSAVAGTPKTWLDFATNSRKHLQTPLVNFMGLPTVVAFSPETSARRLRDTRLADPYEHWHDGFRATLARRAPWLWVAAGAFVLLLAFAVRHEPLWSSAILGTGLAVITSPIACYYYSILCAYGLLGPRREPAGIALLLLSASGWAISSSTLRLEEPYVAQSAACVVYVLLVTALVARVARAKAAAA
jgi:hypothetical protein